MSHLHVTLDAVYLTANSLCQPETCTITDVYWCEFSSEALLRLAEHAKPLPLSGDDLSSLVAITGETDYRRWLGRSVRLYPITLPWCDGIALF